MWDLCKDQMSLCKTRCLFGDISPPLRQSLTLFCDHRLVLPAVEFNVDECTTLCLASFLQHKASEVPALSLCGLIVLINSPFFFFNIHPTVWIYTLLIHSPADKHIWVVFSLGLFGEKSVRTLCANPCVDKDTQFSSLTT